MNFIKKILPSYRSGKDPLQTVMRDGSECPYSPIPLGDLKLTPCMHHKLYKHRKEAAIIDTPRYDKKLGVIVPFRNREKHLVKFVPAIHEFLDKQKIQHEVLVIEQQDDKLFNKGRLLNIGASIMQDKCDYFCFHDIDMVPEIASYAYINRPVLLANSVSQFDADPNKTTEVWHHHPTYFGGVVMISVEDYFAINGFSNNYWHWGYEDDDFHLRCLMAGLITVAYTEGRYKSLPHEKSVSQVVDGDKYYQRNKKYYKEMRRGLIDTKLDGLNNLEYQVIGSEEHDLYTKVSVVL